MIVLLIFASLLVALVFLAGFIWAVRAGQYDDTTTPSLRVLTEEAPAPADARRPRGILHPATSPPAAGPSRRSSPLQSEINRT